MTKLRKLTGLALALLVGAPSAAWTQVAIPGAAAPAVAGPAAVPVAAPAAAPGAAAPKNLWTFLCPTAAQKAACKAKFCGSQFGQLINNSLGPVSALTGGVMPQPCPLIDPAGLLLPPDSALGAAAQVQKDTAEAAARRAAIRYISTADCNWWPEVIGALVNSLRADRNECVRLEAALALRRGCCCNRITIKGLVNALSVFPDDGNPREDSPRVRGAAMASLQHCLACYVALAPVPPPPPPAKVAPPPGEVPLKGPPLVPVPEDLPPAGPPAGPPAVPPAVPPAGPPAQASVAQAHRSIQPAAYTAVGPQQSMEQLVQEARLVLQQAQQQQAQTQRRILVEQPYQPGDRCLLTVIETALHPPAPTSPESARSTTPPQTAANCPTLNAPPVLKPVPQLPPPLLSPRPNPIPAISPTPLVAPAPVAPVSLQPSRPAVAPSPATIVSSENFDTLLSSWVPSHPAAAPTTIPTPAEAGQQPSIDQLLVLLKSSEDPKTRQWAAQSLTSRDGASPAVVKALMGAAAADASDDVRDICLRRLLQLGFDDPDFLAQVNWPLIDGDAHVREAAWQLVLFGKESSGNPQVREAAKALNQWLQRGLSPLAARPS